jgi:hypothetical protein
MTTPRTWYCGLAERKGVRLSKKESSHPRNADAIERPTNEMLGARFPSGGLAGFFDESVIL